MFSFSSPDFLFSKKLKNSSSGSSIFAKSFTNFASPGINFPFIARDIPVRFGRYNGLNERKDGVLYVHFAND